MKKVLFGSTALVAAAFAGQAMAGDVELSLGGGLETGVAFGQYNDSGITRNVDKDFHVIFDGEIHFRGQGTLDNGIEIVTRVELEAASEGDNQIDEQWLQLKSSLGTVMIGGNDSAYASTGYIGFGRVAAAWDGGDDYIPAQIGTFGDSDGLGVHYFTPNIAGLEIGITWQPTADAEATRTEDTGQNVSNTSDRIAIGAAYSNSFGDVDFVIGGGYIMEDLDADSDGEFDEDMYGWGIGAEVDFAGFGVQGRYEYGETDDSATTSDEVTRYGLGVSYATGPWEFGLSGAFEDNDNSGTSEDIEETRIAAGVSYELGNGVYTAGKVFYGDVDFQGSTKDVDGIGGALLLGVSF